MKIAIDNGHGLNTAGKRTPPFPNTKQVIHEWQFNHATAKILKDILEKQGYEVLMVSDTQADTPLMTRINMANNAKCDMFISIHYNAYQSKWGSHGGLETLYNPKSIEGKRLATIMQDELIKETKLRNRGAKSRTDLGVLNYTKMVSVLPELGFMDNLDEAKLMLDVNYQTKCANAMARSINIYYGKNPNSSTPSQINNKKEENKNMKAEKTKFNLNGNKVELDGFIIDGKTYVIARPLLEGLGMKIGWDAPSKTVTVNK